jgi:hypothetical protein
MLTMWQTLNICSCDHILLSGVGAVALLQAQYTEVVKCLGKKHTSAYVQLCSSIQPATTISALATSLLCSPMSRASKAFPSLSFFQTVFTDATYLFPFTQPNIISKVPKEKAKKKANRKLHIGKLIYLAVPVTSTKAITTNLRNGGT